MKKKTMKDGWRIIMIKKTETIQVRLTNYGTIDVVSVPTKIYKDSYNVMKLSCVVPKNDIEGARICKVYATDVDEAGNAIFTSETYNLPYKEDVSINGFEYVVYEDWLPAEFCDRGGNLTLNFAEGIIDNENEIVQLNVSGQFNLFVSGDGYNHAGVKISNYDAVAGKVNGIQNELNNKVNKFKPLGSSTYYEDRVYIARRGFSGDFTDATVPVSQGNTSNAIVQRAGTAIRVGTCSEPNDAVPKYRLDALRTEMYNDFVSDTQLDARIQNLQSTMQTSINNAISGLVNSAPETLDTLGEVADALEENEEVVDALNSAIGTKQNATDNSLNTTAKTIVGAINEINGKISSANTQLQNILGV
jgi:hypothetical protein